MSTLIRGNGLKRVVEQANEMAMEIMDKTDFSNFTKKERHIFFAAIRFDIFDAAAFADKQMNAVIKNETKEKEETEAVDTSPNCEGTFSIDPESDCNNGKCPTKKREKCVAPAKKKAEAGEDNREKRSKNKDKFGFLVDSNTGKINAMLVTGNYSKAEIVEEIGCSATTFQVHLSKLKSSGFLIKKKPDGKLKLVKPRKTEE